MLSVTEKEVVQTRRGEQNIKMTFRKDEITQCVLESGGFSGTFSIFTKELYYNICGTGKPEDASCVFTLKIVYELAERQTEINFSAKYTLEGIK